MPVTLGLPTLRGSNPFPEPAAQGASGWIDRRFGWLIRSYSNKPNASALMQP